jgi:hypothetical protein
MANARTRARCSMTDTITDEQIAATLAVVTTAVD